jgi:hypothetical protein
LRARPGFCALRTLEGEHWPHAPRPTPPPPHPTCPCSAKQDREISAVIKRQCDEKYGPTWQCIVGEDFKASFTHETKHFMFIASGKQNVVRGPVCVCARVRARITLPHAPSSNSPSPCAPPRSSCGSLVEWCLSDQTRPCWCPLDFASAVRLCAAWALLLSRRARAAPTAQSPPWRGGVAASRRCALPSAESINGGRGKRARRLAERG